MSKPQSKPSAHETSVFKFGSVRPWGKRGEEDYIRLNHRDNQFGADDVETDGKGKVTDMPLLIGKPCFGRIETFMRHGDKTQEKTNYYGTPFNELTKCGKCAETGVRSGCAKVVKERIHADPAIRDAVKAWRDDTYKRHNGQRVYTAQSGRLWTKVLKAIANHGPFENSNDAALAKHEAKKIEADKERDRRRKRKERADAKKRGATPDREFIKAAKIERDRRLDVLMKARSQPGMSRRISKLNATGVKVTAHAWFWRTILDQAGRSARPGDVKREMVKRGFAADIGMTVEALRTRLYDDFDRIEELEKDRDGGPIWSPFDDLA